MTWSTSATDWWGGAINDWRINRALRLFGAITGGGGDGGDGSGGDEARYRTLMGALSNDNRDDDDDDDDARVDDLVRFLAPILFLLLLRPCSCCCLLLLTLVIHCTPASSSFDCKTRLACNSEQLLIFIVFVFHCEKGQSHEFGVEQVKVKINPKNDYSSIFSVPKTALAISSRPIAVNVSTMISLVASAPFLSCHVVIAIRARVVLSSASFLMDLMSENKKVTIDLILSISYPQTWYVSIRQPTLPTCPQAALPNRQLDRLSVNPSSHREQACPVAVPLPVHPY